MPGLGRGSGRDRARARDLARDLDLDLARDLVRAFDLARALAHTRDLDFVRVLEPARALDFARVLALARDRALSQTRGLDRALGQNNFRAHALTPALDHVSKLAADFSRPLYTSHALGDKHAAKLSEFRTLLYLIGFFIWDVQQTRLQEASLIQRQSAKWRHDQAVLDSFVIEYLEAFVDLCVLEERSKGNLSAFEGIRIVRERIKEA